MKLPPKNSCDDVSLDSLLLSVISQNEGLRTIEEEPTALKQSYAKTLKANANAFEKGRSPSHNENKLNNNVNEILKSFNRAHRRPKKPGLFRQNTTQK